MGLQALAVGWDELIQRSHMTLSESPPNYFVSQESSTPGLGGANPKSVFIDDVGRPWLFKPQSLEQTMVDIVAARIAQAAGVPTPSVYAADFVWQGRRHQGNIQPNMRDHILKGELSRELRDLTDEQRGALQQHHVVDWLLANADPHRKNFLVLDDDSVVGIDKAQALRFFPHDRLSWHANAWPLNARPPVYRYLVEGMSQGWFALLPETAITFAHQVQSYLAGPSLRQQWQPCIAAWPWYRLVYATLDLNLSKDAAVTAVLDKIDNRRDQLDSEFDQLYFDNSSGIWQRP